MKKTLLLIVCMVFVFAMLAFASDKKDSTMKGWVSDEMCGAKGANAAHEACAKKCADSGQKLVFVDDKEHKVMNVANQDALKEHAGKHVEISATKNSDGSLQVSNVKVMAKNEAAAKPGEAETHKH